MDSQKKVASVALVAGTHGNELTGIYCYKHWTKNNPGQNYPQFQVECHLANPQAITENKRYIDKDLNRCFKLSELNQEKSDCVEAQRAKQLNQMLGPKGKARVDFIIDLHTSTANMRTNIVLIKIDEFHLKLAAYLKSVLPDVIITSESNLMDDHHFLCSIAEKNLLIEIGPIPQGALQADCYAKTNDAVTAALDFVALYNQNKVPALADELPLMSYFSKLYFPVDEAGDINALVHPDLIGQDYTQIKSGDPIFIDLSGNNILYTGETAYIAFVNEAAYYDQKIAMCLCHSVTYSLSSLQKIG